MLISIVVPFFNEEESIQELYERIVKAVSLSAGYEIIFVDDGSSDTSSKIVENLHAMDKNVRLISFRKNFGKSMALGAGFEFSHGDIVITMDADLQDQPEEIPLFIEKIHSGFDLVSGWKYPRHDSWHFVFASKLFNRFVSILFGLRIHDVNCGFKAYKADVVKSLDVYGELHRFLPVIAHQKGFRVTEIKIQHARRKYGKSKYGVWKFFYGLIDMITVLLLTKYVQKPAHFFGTTGILFFVSGFALSLYLTIRWFMGHGIASRPLFFLGILLIIVSIQLISLGLLGEILVSKDRNKMYKIKKIL